MAGAIVTDTDLQIAVRSGSLEAVRALLEAGADPNSKDQFGRSAKDYAQRRHYREIIKELSEWQPNGSNETRNNRLKEATQQEVVSSPEEQTISLHFTGPLFPYLLIVVALGVLILAAFAIKSLIGWL